MKKALLVLPLVAMVAIFAACGGSSTTTSDTPTISSLAELPKATSPMSAATTDLSVPIGMSQKSLEKANAAVTGQNISTVTSTANAFNYKSSVGSCNTFNTLKAGISAASQADMIICFISNLNSKFSGMTDDHGDPIDIYDGGYHIFNMHLVGDAGAPDRVKMKIMKTGNSITDFRMWMCKKNPVTDALYQNEYSEQVITNGTGLSMTSLGLWSDSYGSGRHYVNVEGTLNGSRNYTRKVITTKDYNQQPGFDAPNYWQETSLTQTPASFDFSGYSKGSYSNDFGTGTFVNTAVGLGQMIGDTGALVSALAMGDGAVKYTQYNKNTAVGYEFTNTQSGTNAWDGDTTYPETADTNDYYATAAGYTYSTPAVLEAYPEIKFAGAQEWDCEDSATEPVGIYDMPETQFADINTQCTAYQMDGQWIDCYQAIGNCNGDNICEGGGFSTAEQKAACRLCFTDGNARKAGTETETCLATTFGGDWSQQCPALP